MPSLLRTYANVEQVIQTTYTPEQCEKRYRTMIRAIASGRRQSVDPSITEASGRFQVDAEKDLAVARRRVQAVQRIEAAQARLVELRANPPQPPPNGQTPLSEFSTLGELAVAIAFLNGRNALWGPKVDWDAAVSEAGGEIKRAVGHLRATSDLSIDESIRSARASIQRVNEAVAERAALQEKLDDLRRQIEKSNPQTEEAKTSALALRAEFGQVAKRLAALSEPDMEAISAAQAEIDKLAGSQLSPENLQFTEPSGKQQGIYPVPVRFA